ncbi:uncharacterized protein FIBRA_09438 [Fibroporia radiculosa]|uniref:Uncharacterized protein n=1 Tax=Fibroporia radiculosa TaxID=599839 RepID=J7RHN5_9APHY|nr:uncharacterized protein FIBRA_09438 [Fibroporia radiculosa]CCM07107.1 predicted protein [Fibroporia radiculosa]
MATTTMGGRKKRRASHSRGIRLDSALMAYQNSRGLHVRCWISACGKRQASHSREIRLEVSRFGVSKFAWIARPMLDISVRHLHCGLGL